MGGVNRSIARENANAKVEFRGKPMPRPSAANPSPGSARPSENALLNMHGPYRGTSLITNDSPLGPPKSPRQGPTVGSYGVAVSDT